MQAFVNWVNSHVHLPNDSPRRRTQKTIFCIANLCGSVSLMIGGTMFLVGGVPFAGWFYIIYALYQALIVGVALLRPQTFDAMFWVMGLSLISLPWVIHIFLGGFDTGLAAYLWALVAPIGGLIVADRKSTFVILGLLGVIITGMAIINPAVPMGIPEWLVIFTRLWNIIGVTGFIFIMSLYFFNQLEQARAQADNLLHNILPHTIAEELKTSPGVIADGHPEVTVLFADIVDFTTLSAEADPEDVVKMLNDVFSDFDNLTIKHGLEKIKTIGDAYMVAGGIPDPHPDHCAAVVAFAVDMLATVKRHKAWNGEPIRLRVGINTGPVVAGVIGRQKFIYDLWGDAVNTASRMESHGQADVIQVTEAVKQKLDGTYTFDAQPPTYIKGKGEMVTYFLKA